MTNIKNFLNLRLSDKRTLVKALVFLPAVAFMIRLVGLRRSLSVLVFFDIENNKPVMSEGEAVSVGWHLAHLVEVAAVHGFIRANCLHRSMVLWWLLRRQGIDVDLRIGVKRDSGILAAHAWIDYSGMPICDTQSEQFSPFAVSFTP